MIYWLHRLGAPISKWVPLWLCYGLAHLISLLVFLAWQEKRHNAIQNMARVLGTTPDSRHARWLALRSFMNYGKYLVDMLRIASMKPVEIEQRITIEGWEHFAGAFDESTGVIFVGGHIGNSDMAAAFLAGRGFPVHVITETLHPPRWDAVVQAARAAVGLHVIPMETGALQSLRVLRQQGILATLIDRPLEDRGVAVQFFGDTVRVPAGVAALALRSGAQVLGAYMVRTGNSFALRVSPVIPHPSTGDPSHDVQALTQAIFAWLERVIRQHPDQWFMFRLMWPPIREPGYSHG